jgi:hypothetical protein
LRPLTSISLGLVMGKARPTAVWTVFEPTAGDAVPSGIVGDAATVPCYTWGARARAIVHAFAECLPRLPPPARRRVAAQGLYGVTYELGSCGRPDGPVEQGLAALSRSLRSFPLPEPGLLLLRGLFDDRIDGVVVHALFARMREILTRQDPESFSLHAPIEPCPVLRSAFPLHADLFQATTLLTIFDEVAPDGTGGSLLMAVREFQRLLDGLDAIPAAVRSRLAAILGSRGGDGYEAFVDLLYGPDRAWRDDLLEALAGAAHRIKFDPGEGYMLDDRRWLHGREMSSVSVTPNRLQRLVFMPATS